MPALGARLLPAKRPRAGSTADINRPARVLQSQSHHAAADTTQRSYDGQQSEGIEHLSVNKMQDDDIDPAKKYAKRKRYKTKADKYEMKNERVKASDHKRGAIRRKTTTMLHNSFKAPNVPQERLTLRPQTGPGFLHKGKASSPVQRRGLPDLTFSEMKFLSNRRDLPSHPGTHIATVKKTNNRPDKHSAGQIASFFEQSQEQPDRGPRVSVGEVPQMTSSPAKLIAARANSMVSSLCTDLGARSTLAPSRSISRVPHGRLNQVTSAEHKHRVATGNQEIRPQFQSSSYVTWSPSPPRNRLSREQQDHQLEAVQDPILANLRPLGSQKHSETHNGSGDEEQYQIHSSMSDAPLYDTAKRALLGEKLQTWDPVRLVPRYAHYSHDDLKRLGRLTEMGSSTLDNTDKRPGIHQQIVASVTQNFYEDRSRKEQTGRDAQRNSNSSIPPQISHDVISVSENSNRHFHKIRSARASGNKDNLDLLRSHHADVERFLVRHQTTSQLNSECFANDQFLLDTRLMEENKTTNGAQIESYDFAYLDEHQNVGNYGVHTTDDNLSTSGIKPNPILTQEEMEMHGLVNVSAEATEECPYHRDSRKMSLNMPDDQSVSLDEAALLGLHLHTSNMPRNLLCRQDVRHLSNRETLHPTIEALEGQPQYAEDRLATALPRPGLPVVNPRYHALTMAASELPGAHDRPQLLASGISFEGFRRPHLLY